MPINDYHFVTHWRVQGAVRDVYDIFKDPLTLPRWWPSVYLKVADVTPGDPVTGVGREVDLCAKGWLPYVLCWRFRLTAVNEPYSMTLEATGDLTGTGIWTMEQSGAWVDITYDWNVRADKSLLRKYSWLLRPVFAINHNWTMAQGEKSLQLELARRHATTPEERAAVALPPGPTPTSPVPYLLGVAAVALLGGGVVYGVVRLRRKR